TATAQPVHVTAANEVIWLLNASSRGRYKIAVTTENTTADKEVVVGNAISRISTSRLRAPLWRRFFESAEPGLPDASPIKAIEVNYPSRTIEFAWIEWNWIVLFFILSLAAGFIFKSALGIEI